jgi:hypothetical protein
MLKRLQNWYQKRRLDLVESRLSECLEGLDIKGSFSPVLSINGTVEAFEVTQEASEKHQIIREMLHVYITLAEDILYPIEEFSVVFSNELEIRDFEDIKKGQEPIEFSEEAQKAFARSDRLSMPWYLTCSREVPRSIRFG